MAESAVPLVIDIVSDVVCPWCYLGKKRLEAALATSGEQAELRWRPYQLDPTIPPEGLDRKAYMEAKFGKGDRLKQAHDRTQCSFGRRRFLAGANLRVADFPASVPGSHHESHSQQRKNQHGRQIPARHAGPAMDLPQSGQRESPRRFKEPQGQHGRAFVALHEGIRYAGLVLKHELRTLATRKGRDRNQGHGRENDKAASPQSFVFPKEGNEKEAEADDAANHRKVIQQEVYVHEVHDGSTRAPKFGKLPVCFACTVSPAPSQVNAKQQIFGRICGFQLDKPGSGV